MSINNEVLIDGVIANQPQLVEMDKMSVLNFSLDFPCWDKQDRPREMGFIRVALYGTSAQIAEADLRKGDRVVVNGKLYPYNKMDTTTIRCGMTYSGYVVRKDFDDVDNETG